jgi:GR25 family glycosyltransferase involved in LPS biosynthesis
MPSDNFFPKYEMVGGFIPLVDVPTSTYPKIMQPTYVLSIRPERLEQFSQRMGQWMIHCKRPPCVVGKKLDKSQLYRNHTIDSKGGKMKLGEIGCWLSHLKSWQCIAASPYESGTIMEDDASFGTNLQRVDLAMEELKQKNIPWDILFWCHSPIPHVSQYLKPCGLDNWSRASRNNCMGCIAYTIKKHVAQIWSQRAKPIQSPVDVWVAEYFDRFQVYCIKPVLGSILPSVSDTTETMNPGYLKYL